jgi:hypothetical protein
MAACEHACLARACADTRTPVPEGLACASARSGHTRLASLAPTEGFMGGTTRVVTPSTPSPSEMGTCEHSNSRMPAPAPPAVGAVRSASSSHTPSAVSPA